jgi:dephospho-CoA kinase
VERWKRAQGRKTRSPRLAVVEVPLLFEKGWEVYFDGVLSVSAPPTDRKRRLSTRGWDREEIRRRERGQWSQERKDRAADWVLLNDGSLARLAGRVRAWRLACGGKGTR